MAKILHTGDIHLGIKLSGLGKSGDKVRASLKDAFARMIDICLESDVDAFVIAGDLFDSNRVSKPLLDFALREIARLLDRGLIVLIDNKVEGFVPTGKLGIERLKKPADAFKVGEKIHLQVIEFDKDEKKIVLSADEYYRTRDQAEYEAYVAAHQEKAAEETPPPPDQE